MFLKRLYSLLFVSKRSEFYLYRSILGFSPGNLSLYSLAFVHGSCIVKDPQGNIINNERLEFLGDAVLNTIVSEMLYHRYPHENEGTLTGMRSGIVSRESLNLIADSLKLEAMIRANLRDVNDARNIGGNTLEALIGAIFLDRGYKKANEFVNNKIISRINPEELLRDDHNYKGKIIEISRKHNAEVEFSVSAQSLPKETPHFRCDLLWNGEMIGSGEGGTKKEAEKNAAAAAIEKLNETNWKDLGNCIEK